MDNARDELKREIRKTEDDETLGKVEAFVRGMKAEKEMRPGEPERPAKPGERG